MTRPPAKSGPELEGQSSGGTALTRVATLLLCILILLVFGIAFVMRFRLSVTPFSGPDTIGYLGVAIQYLETGTFTAIAERSYPYPLFLTAILTVFRDVSVIPVIQHVLGLVAGALLLQIWDDVDRLFLGLPAGAEKSLYWLIGTGALLTLLCSEWSVLIEHHTHPESLTSLLVMGLMIIHIRLYSACKTPSPIPQLVWGVFALFVNYLFFIYQPRYGLNVLIVAAITGILLLRMVGLWRSVQVIALSALVIWAALVLPFSQFSDRASTDLNRTGALFFHNLKTIAPFIEADLRSAETDVRKAELLRAILLDLQEARNPENEFSTGFSKSLGLNTDYLLRTYYKVLEYYDNQPEAAQKFYASYLSRAIVGDPVGLTDKVIGEFVGFYAGEIAPRVKGWAPHDLWLYSRDVIVGFKAYFPNATVLTNYISALELMVDMPVEVRPFGRVYAFVLAIEVEGKKWLPALIVLFLVVCLANVMGRGRHRALSLVTFCILLLHFGLVATVSVANTTAVGRYLTDQLAVLILFEAFALACIALSAADWARRIASPPRSPAVA